MQSSKFQNLTRELLAADFDKATLQIFQDQVNVLVQKKTNQHWRTHYEKYLDPQSTVPIQQMLAESEFREEDGALYCVRIGEFEILTSVPRIQINHSSFLVCWKSAEQEDLATLLADPKKIKLRKDNFGSACMKVESPDPNTVVYTVFLLRHRPFEDC